MLREIGVIEAIFRYPVKSMRGEQVNAAAMGWHGLEGDRRLAFRKIDDVSGFPWLTASKFPDLVLYSPQRSGDPDQFPLPTHVRTPDGEEMPIFGKELAADVERRCGIAVEMMQWRQGMFDEASISIIAADTVREICELGGVTADARRFRPNVFVRLTDSAAFAEDRLVGAILQFGDQETAPAVTVSMRDVRCAMINIDPDSGERAPEMLKAVVRVNDNNAGVYASVVRPGQLAVGQKLFVQSP